MRRVLPVLFLTIFTPVSFAQGVTLDTDKKKFSYAVGVQIGQSLIRQGVDLDPNAFSLAIRDATDGSKPRLSAAEMERVLNKGESSVNEGLKEKAKANLQAGKAFLAENKSKEGVIELSSGLQYKVDREGAGDFAKPNSDVVVHYVGTLIDGREFDSSRRRGEPATLNLGRVIKGWQEAIPLMREGSRWTIYVPPSLGYGAQGAGAVIEPNSTLIFEIELLEVLKK
ncbi:MAG: FKBP-type peptidyl-prolyl cis-trans isomerase [Gammaproteobacteria bacterium]